MTVVRYDNDTGCIKNSPATQVLYDLASTSEEGVKKGVTRRTQERKRESGGDGRDGTSEKQSTVRYLRRRTCGDRAGGQSLQRQETKGRTL